MMMLAGGFCFIVFVIEAGIPFKGHNVLHKYSGVQQSDPYCDT